MLRALAIAEKNFGPESHAVGNALRSIGDNYLDAGEYAKARSYSLHALDIFEKLEPPGQPSTGVAYVLGDLARSSRGLGDPQGALEYSERGLKIHEEALGPEHPDNAVYLVDIARVLFETGQHDAGRAAARRADEIIREHLNRTAHVASEEQALAYAAARPPAGDLLITAAAGNPERAEAAVIAAWDSAIRSRGQVLDSMIERRHLLVESRDPGLAGLVGSLQRATERLAKLVVQGPGHLDEQAYRQTLDSASKEKERAELALAERSADHRGKLARSRAGLAEVAAALPSQTALVAFVRYGRVDLTTRAGGKPQPLTLSHSTPAYAAFILSSAGAVPVVVPLGDGAVVDPLVARWRTTTAREALAAGRASKAGEASYRKAAEELRRALWDPIAFHLADATQVFVVPDGGLNLLNLAALPTSDGRYLVEVGPRLHYLSAERDLASPDSAGPRGGLLALSDPDFNDRQLFAALGPRQLGAMPVPDARIAAAFRGSRSACSRFQSMRFEALPASAREAREIVRLWGDDSSASSFTGPAANETTFKQTAGGHRVLHLATHGYFLGGDCGSALESPMDGRAPSSSAAVTRENPLLLSGLVLAGANHREAAGPDEDDGILTAEEIATLDLQGTEWAVLSACDTGTGEIRAGEGVFGLRRAFQLAGARTVIMSLWPVDDEAARQWMTALYRHRFVEEKSTARSVNDASVELLRLRRSRGQSTHPFYWAGFIAAGDWR
jgi:CHAT domain-containing protein